MDAKKNKMKKTYLNVLTFFLSVFVATSLFAAPLTSADAVVMGDTDAGVNVAGFDSDYNAAVKRAKHLFQGNVAQASELYMAGDSIMADYKSNQWPQYGWG